MTAQRAARAARERNVPIVLDPVGAGATRLRTDTALALIGEAAPAVIRGNASEIIALLGSDAATKGVDSVHASDAALDAAGALAAKYSCVVSVSGETDLITGGGRLIRVRNGHPMMPRVTGLGCVASALTGAFLAVNASTAAAAAHAMAVAGMAGEIAAEQAAGPGTFMPHFLDALYHLGEDDVRQRLQMEIEA